MMSKYDFLVIGSGLGGLECAAILSREGYNVCVVEKNRQIGGNLQTFARDKKIFDTGVHYIGGLDEGQNLHTFFEFLGIMDGLKLRKMDAAGFDVISFENDPEEYRHAQGYDAFVDTLAEKFPQERANIESYCHKIREICSRFPMYNVKPGYATLENLEYLSESARDFIARCTANEKLRQVLAGTNLLYAGEGDLTPVYVHAMIVNSYIESAYRCVDGGSQIARLLTRIIKENGGTVINKSEAVRFEFEGENIRAVELKNGEKLEARNFISNIHPVNTLEMVEDGKLRKAYRHRMASLKNSVAAFVVYLVLKEKSMAYLNYNMYHTLENDVWNTANYSTWPSMYGIFAHASSKKPDYTEALVLMTYMKYDEVKQWENTFNIVSKEDYRGDDYEAFKKEKAEKLISLAEKKLPGLTNKIEAYYTSTPLTYRDYIGSKDGSMYGIIKDYKDPMKTFIQARTKIPNLYLTGQNLNLHGVLGVTIGAMVTCSEILGNEYLVGKIGRAL